MLRLHRAREREPLRCAHHSASAVPHRHPASDSPVERNGLLPSRRNLAQDSCIEPRRALRRWARSARAPCTFVSCCKKGAQSTQERAERIGARRRQGGRWAPAFHVYQWRCSGCFGWSRISYWSMVVLPIGQWPPRSRGIKEHLEADRQQLRQSLFDPTPHQDHCKGWAAS